MQPTPKPPENPLQPGPIGESGPIPARPAPAPAPGSPLITSESQFPFRPTAPESVEEQPKTASVLVVHPDSGTLRIVRESLTSFRACQVETTPDAEYGFELALKKSYDLFVFGLSIPVLGGELLYSLISRAYTFSHKGALTAPAVIYVGDSKDASRAAELKQDARVKGVVFRPFKIDRFLNSLGESLPKKT